MKNSENKRKRLTKEELLKIEKKKRQGKSFQDRVVKEKKSG